LNPRSGWAPETEDARFVAVFFPVLRTFFHQIWSRFWNGHGVCVFATAAWPSSVFVNR
jgi:hypothetical protein